MRLFALLAAAAAIPCLTVGRAYAAEPEPRVSGPHIYKNLAVYFIHGQSASGPVPLTLGEALERDRVVVTETGQVSLLTMKNTGQDSIFIQAGDIVKGGKQDRVITSSFVLKSNSGDVPVDAFCVEAGRWSSRGQEAVGSFSSSAEAMPSLRAKMAMRAPVAKTNSGEPRQYAFGADRQTRVWDSVSSMQKKFSDGIKAKVASAESESSLQLSLENKELKQSRAAYVDAIKAAGYSEADIIGLAFAINGKINSADVYESNGLFRKMWLKQLQAAATEAIGETGGEAADAASATTIAFPNAEAIKDFLAKAKDGAAVEMDAAVSDKLKVRDSARAVYFAASAEAAAPVVHENYLAK